MRLIIQRVKEAAVIVDHKTIAAINTGLLVLVGFGQGDETPEAWAKIQATLAKLPVLRIFPDNANRMNLSLADCGGDILLVSQFTLYADCHKGRRPSFHPACAPELAELLYAKMAKAMDDLYPGKVQSGIFAANMDITLTNWGPVTILLDSSDF